MAAFESSIAKHQARRHQCSNSLALTSKSTAISFSSFLSFSINRSISLGQIMAAAAPADSGAMEGVVAPEAPSLAQPAPVPAATTAGVVPPAEDNYTCETLYIQNLNEKIKVDGMYPSYYLSLAH